MKNYRVTEKRTPDGRAVLCGSEENEQEKVIQWSENKASVWPQLKLLYHVPNGGSRNRVEAAKLKRMGVKAGVPDLVLPIPMGGYAGLYIEMKVGSNKPTKRQQEWIECLKMYGHRVQTCYCANEAIETIENYMKSGCTEMRQKDYKSVEEYLSELNGVF